MHIQVGVYTVFAVVCLSVFLCFFAAMLVCIGRVYLDDDVPVTEVIGPAACAFLFFAGMLVFVVLMFAIGIYCTVCPQLFALNS